MKNTRVYALLNIIQCTSWEHNPISKWTNVLNRLFWKGEAQMVNITLQVFNMLTHWENANENVTEIPSYHSQNGYQANVEQLMMAREKGNKEFLNSVRNGI
jgi:hypothetical protein